LPVIIIEVFLAFGGVLFLYWWSMRDIKKWKERKNTEEIEKKN
tara:strand:- start:38161 stop:38289 length:129 start_codon:yes stop_codon:yes gene_type:complete